MGYQPLARDGTRLHSGRAQTLLGGGERQKGPLHTWPWSHQSNPEWRLPRVTEESGDGSGYGGGHGWVTEVPWGCSVGLLCAGAERFRREEVRQELPQTAWDGAQSSAYAVETSGL